MYAIEKVRAGRPRGEPTNKINRSSKEEGHSRAVVISENIGFGGEELSYEDLVRGVREYVAAARGAHLLVFGTEYSPAELISRKLKFQWQSRSFSNKILERKRLDFFFDLSVAWDALAYGRFTPHSLAAACGGAALAGYANEYERTSVKLTSPRQTKFLAACAEVAGIPYEEGQMEIPIPEAVFKLRR